MDKTTYGLDDICARYNVGLNKGREIIRRIAYVNDGLCIGKSNILWSEIQFYEARRGRKPGDSGIASEEDVRVWEASNSV